jgi:hypothetical protein
MTTSALGEPRTKMSDLFRKLLLADVARELGTLDTQDIPSSRELSFLLTNASLLALSAPSEKPEDSDSSRIAYEIAVRVPNFANGNRAAFAAMSDIVLTRLGNFPARQLMREKTGFGAHSRHLAALEMFSRERENYVDGSTGPLLTNFQTRLIDALESKLYVSVSAPTSAGKSYTLELELLRRLKGEKRYTAVYLVPTRALIRQVSLDLAQLVKENGSSALVLSSPTLPEDATGPKQFVFVLTQERFATLLASQSKEFMIDAIVVDEAQEVENDSRGMTLERVIRLAISRFPSTRLFFSCPLRSNPEFLLELFNKRGPDSLDFIEYHAPVTQNLISIAPVSKSPKDIKVS